MKFNMLPQPAGLAKVMLSLFCMIDIQERARYLPKLFGKIKI